ncbi:MAG: c-type cytochrome [Chloroflexales bacterium]|nr:c-type cytochrome [Chloroflexales bacterium]
MGSSNTKKRRQYRQRNLIIGSVVVLMSGALALSIWSGFSSNNASNTGTAGIAGVNSADANNAELVARGKEVYAAYCASCHGANLEGRPNWDQERPGGGRPAPPLESTGRAWRNPDQLLFEITKYGGQASSPPGYVNNMPGFENILTDEEIWASLAYIKSTWPPDIQAAQEDANLEAR